MLPVVVRRLVAAFGEVVRRSELVALRSTRARLKELGLGRSWCGTWLLCCGGRDGGQVALPHSAANKCQIEAGIESADSQLSFGVPAVLAPRLAVGLSGRGNTLIWIASGGSPKKRRCSVISYRRVLDFTFSPLYHFHRHSCSSRRRLPRGAMLGRATGRLVGGCFVARDGESAALDEMDESGTGFQPRYPHFMTLCLHLSRV